MQCPYCASEMKPCGSVLYTGSRGVTAVEWVRCPRCEHATVARTKPLFARSPSIEQTHAATSCLATSA
jgi:hypothetical protein